MLICFYCLGICSIQGQEVKVFRPDEDEDWIYGLVTHQDPISRIINVTMSAVCIHFQK